MFKRDEKGTVRYLDKDNKDQILLELGQYRHTFFSYYYQKLYFSKNENQSCQLFQLDLKTLKSDPHEIKLHEGNFTIVNDFIVFIDPQRNL